MFLSHLVLSELLFVYYVHGRLCFSTSEVASSVGDIMHPSSTPHLITGAVCSRGAPCEGCVVPSVLEGYVGGLVGLVGLVGTRSG